MAGVTSAPSVTRLVARIAFFVVAALLVFAPVEVRAQIAASPLPSTSASPSVAAELKPGTTIGADNVEQYARYVPAAGKFAIAHGFRMRVIPARRVEWSQGFQHATEKYAAQVSLDSDGYIKNYVAGMPFPLIEANDPTAAAKIAYNWHMGPFMPDDFSIAPWSSNAYASDPANALKIVPNPDADYACEQFEFLRFAHRTDLDPRPTIGDNRAGRRVEGEMQSMAQRSRRYLQRRCRHLGPLSRREASRRIFLASIRPRAASGAAR